MAEKIGPCQAAEEWCRERGGGTAGIPGTREAGGLVRANSCYALVLPPRHSPPPEWLVLRKSGPQNPDVGSVMDGGKSKIHPQISVSFRGLNSEGHFLLEALILLISFSLQTSMLFGIRRPCLHRVGPGREHNSSP